MKNYVLWIIELLNGKVVREDDNLVVATSPNRNPQLKSVTFTDFNKDKGKFFLTKIDGVSGGDGCHHNPKYRAF